MIDSTAKYVAALRQAGVAVARRGPDGAQPGRELDLWISPDDLSGAIDVLAEMGGAPVAGLIPSRPHHLTVALPEGTLIDLSVGDLSLGPHILRHATEVAPDTIDGRLSGASAIVDLLPRRLLAGKQWRAEHIATARAEWMSLDRPARQALLREAETDFGPAVTKAVRATLEGGTALDGQSVARRARGRYLFALLRSPRGRAHARRTALARISRWPRPFGWSMRGTLVVLAGTDGTGKSTTGQRLVDRLASLEIPASLQYFGRTRGNLPGVRMIRDALERRDPSTHSSEPREAPQRWHGIRRTASLFYAAEYSLRFWFGVFPRLARGEIVILDRYVYDLAVMPGAARPALHIAKALVPEPSIVLLLEAPPEEIHQRKPERSVAAIRERQATFASVARGLGGAAIYRVSTSSSAPDPIPAISAQVIRHAHRRHLPGSLSWPTPVLGKLL